jgi:hypothetical protein
VEAEGRQRDGAQVAELTGLLPAGTLADYPPGTRVLARAAASTSPSWRTRSAAY